MNEAARLRVRVLDANDNGVSDVRVTFRVLAPGRGTFAGARGNGRAVPDQTDRSGYASASLTPSDDGDLIVRASAAGVSADVTFIIDVGAASTTGTPDTGTPDTGTPGYGNTSRDDESSSGCACRCGESSTDVMGRRGCDLRTCGCEANKDSHRVLITH